MRSIFVEKLETIQESIEDKNEKVLKNLLIVRESMFNEGYIETDKAVKALDEAIELIKKDEDYKTRKLEHECIPIKERMKLTEPSVVEDAGDVYGELEEVIEWLNDPDEVNAHTFIEDMKVNSDPDIDHDIMEALLYNKNSYQKLITLPNIIAESWFEELSEKIMLENPDIIIR